MRSFWCTLGMGLSGLSDSIRQARSYPISPIGLLIGFKVLALEERQGETKAIALEERQGETALMSAKHQRDEGKATHPKQARLKRSEVWFFFLEDTAHEEAACQVLGCQSRLHIPHDRSTGNLIHHLEDIHKLKDKWERPSKDVRGIFRPSVGSSSL